MAYDGAGSVHALRLRVARLASDGSTPAGATNAYISSALVKISWKPRYEEGEEIVKKNGSGEICLRYNEDDTLKDAEFKLELCTPDPELEEILAGGTVITTTGNATGYAAPVAGAAPQPNGVSIEAWSRAIVAGAAPASNPYLWWVFPRVKGLKRQEASLEADAHNPTFEGTAEENASWGNGPFNDWLATPTGRVWQWNRTSSLPVAALGYATVPAQV